MSIFWLRAPPGSCSSTVNAGSASSARRPSRSTCWNCQLQNDEGPGLDCFHTGRVVLHSNLVTTSPWPLFASECTKTGFASVCAVPLRLKGHILGCLNMFMINPAGLIDNDVALAQALADFASIAIVHDQATRDAAVRERHLQYALTSRVAIEQAKGIIAERHQVDMDNAFSRLRTYTRNNNRRLTDVAEALVAGTITVDAIAPRRGPPSPPPAPTPLTVRGLQPPVQSIRLKSGMPARSHVVAAACRQATHFGDCYYVTGIVGTLDLQTGTLRWINASHVLPLLVRNGTYAAPLRCRPALLLGLGGPVVEVAEQVLQSDDRVLFTPTESPMARAVAARSSVTTASPIFLSERR